MDQVPQGMAELGQRLGRRYSRYGLEPAQLVRALESMPRPDAVLMSCAMTYWYPGVREAADLLHRVWPDVPVALGGIYATLCPDHARRHAGVSHVVPGPLEQALPALSDIVGLELADRAALPAHDLATTSDAAALQTSVGCPHRCLYCGVAALTPRYQAFSAERVEREVRAIVALGIRQLAIYDDAFLARPQRAVEILERLAPLSVRLHASSGLSCRGLTAKVARAMRDAGFVSVRLGLETADPQAQERLGAKVTTEELSAALDHLEAAGFPRREIGVYVMGGLPGQERADVQHSLERVLALGARPHLAEYSPVPGSPLFDEACAASPYPLAEEPLFQNPTLLPCAAVDGNELAGIKTWLRQQC
jgi:radical SAM superfamily enzyme YgiQ (UPF0313 family)